jgi:phosphoserine phosphatase
VPAPQNIIAVIFDVDDTLTDDSTTQLLASRNVDTDKFWKIDVRRRVDEGWDPALAYLNLMIELMAAGKPLAGLSNQDLFDFGKTIKFYPGLPAIFKDLKKLVGEHTLSNPSVEFYIISGGLEAVIRGSSIAQYMSGIWGCRFDEKNGKIWAVKNVVSFTEKTRFIFEINKGLRDGRTKPFEVNHEMDPLDRRIPLESMKYVGDGLTDVPCFSLLGKNKGKGFGVFDPKREGSPKKAWEQLVTPRRVTSLNAPKYRRTDELGSLLRAAVNGVCVNLDLRTQAAVR